ncbi:Dihydrolipoyllysine-residue acetyltransferase component of pyruvate dehydrogenase complex [Achromobacter xylosoxidans]|uniref:dihydrolipoyllysine-residue acetyltransferase n=4 Tax=Alcaligenes xylosoxydans xylosoxydans TaxID=85698 RepID=UPI0004F8F87C|nr:dihydrolipoyllysine-residue acetyltransferase [Achromobacter xylosoxidans]MDC6163022.1 dihydrolipoyllysine-residue acetyltransferase [Achromobacter xylosoxidans]PWV40429.1 dihydrolipoyllysine-residue acetyltransferase [Achromobacter xylosoxidans]QEQ22964.1 dihydrolipoyllysine-residue acetyltransferase [Achromobacter xylosoxidans]CUI84181.1 Dihydrolipoyllysine-residue acetyltransferase component of pyruvate dehydrogenase complex [Achromobacter xylosoxidans]CUI92312.1 Dihydrolipoyllysine-resi
MSNVVQIKVPDIGDFKEVEVIEVLVAVGDTIKAEQSLITVESDKASMEIPASQGGVVKSIAVKVGDKVAEGAVVLEVEAADAAAPAAKEEPKAEAPRQAAAAAPAAKAEAAAPAASSGPVEIEVPDIGDFKEVEVIEVMVAVGDTIKAEQSLITVESDKASMEIPASQGGVVKEVKVKVGDKVAKGSVVVVVEGSAPAAAAAPAAKAEAAPARSEAPAAKAEAPAAPATPAVGSRPAPAAALEDANLKPGQLPHASPSVRKFARELGVNLSKVKGTGPKDRITADDVRGFVKTALASGAAPAAAGGSADGAALGLLPWPKVDFTKFGPIEAKPLSRIKKISGANLHRNWVMIPHVTNNDEADITDLEALRVTLNKENEKSGIKVTMLAFLIKAVVAALKKFPEFNASLDGDNLVLKQYYHIGFAADTPNGLVVPVIRDADKKGILQIAQEMTDLSKKAREGKISPAEMQGGCFSISSLGGIGGTSFTPIINAPEVAILGVSRSSHKPVWDGKQFVPRLIVPLSLSYDHRVIDGAAAARFNAYLGALLADFRRIAL